MNKIWDATLVNLFIYLKKKQTTTTTTKENLSLFKKTNMDNRSGIRLFGNETLLKQNIEMQDKIADLKNCDGKNNLQIYGVAERKGFKI